jgi:hypothetical protein
MKCDGLPFICDVGQIPVVKILTRDKYNRMGLYWTVYYSYVDLYSGDSEIVFKTPSDMRKFLIGNYRIVSSLDLPGEITYFRILKYSLNKRAKSKKVRRVSCIVEKIKLRELNLELIGV